MTSSKNNLIWCWLSLLVILIDQLSKYMVLHALTLYQSTPVFPFFNLRLLHNTGASFGFLSPQPRLAFWLFSTIAVVMSAIILVWLYRLPRAHRSTACALSLVLGGAVGNLIDRFVHGHVIDFLDFYYQSWHFPAFNIADSAIFVGAVLLCLATFFKRPPAL